MNIDDAFLAALADTVDDQYDDDWDEDGEPWAKFVDPDARPVPSDFDSRPRWHYCNIWTLAGKLRAGELVPYYEHGYPDNVSVVWGSSNPLWEPDCAVSWLMGLAEGQYQQRFCEPGGVIDAARIALRPADAPFRYNEYWSAIGIPVPEELVMVLTDSDRECARDWWVNPDPIPASRWVRVEVWDSVALKWIPLWMSSDRMVRDLISLLPGHLRGGEVHDSCLNRISSAARGSIYLPTRYSELETASWNAMWEFWDDSPDPEQLLQDDLDHLYGVRRQWFEAEQLARAGVSVTPVGRGKGGVRPDAVAWATHRPEMVDKFWLVDYPGDRYGVVLGLSSGNLFAVKLTGHYRHGAFTRDGLATTLVYDREQDPEQGRGYSIALFKAPEGLAVRPGEAADALGGIEVITAGVIEGSCRSCGYGTTRRAGPLVPATATTALVECLNARTRGENKVTHT